ncbi:MAG: sigma-54-dependent Fis family transcriptional regulator [Phycisphaerales bacterium]|nr:MAG: sigma-54-dependent Fis family transcriptional regulator [Phycisphaerales bacterium]
MTLGRIVALTANSNIRELADRIAREVFVADSLAEALDIAGTTKPDLILLDHCFNSDHIRPLLDGDMSVAGVPVAVVGGHRTGHGKPLKEPLSSNAGVNMNEQNDPAPGARASDRQGSKLPTDSRAKPHDDFFAEDFAAAVSMVGKSRAMLNTLKMIKLVAHSRCNPALVLGETGTGKELAAKAIHYLRHPTEPFVAVNCAALTANLLESELFGHAKGSFTGANREKTGLLEVAGCGTIFLDEISEMPAELQPKLLRILQERVFRKVGGIKDIACNATIIASSNRNLQKEAQTGRFRRDLYYRLSVSPITMAPLRSKWRRDDIELLAQYFLGTSTICPNRLNKISGITRLALETLHKHDWPGNVRELRNVIERAILLETTDKIGLNNIVINLPDSDETSDGSGASSVGSFSLEKAERELISRALQETGWQKSRAAALLGITRTTLYAKVKQYNIEKGSYIARSTDSRTSPLPTPEPADAKT